MCPLGFSFRASSIRVTIRITNRCNFLYYVFISFFSSFPYMFRAFMSPSSGVFQAVVFMLPFGSCSALLIVCVRQRTGLWWWLRCDTEVTTYKKSHLLVILIVTYIKDARYEKSKDWNVISPDCLAPTKWVCFEPTVWPDTCCSAQRIRVSLQWTKQLSV